MLHTNMPPSLAATSIGCEWSPLLYTFPTHFALEDGGTIFFQNVGNTVNFHMVIAPKRMINIKNHWNTPRYEPVCVCVQKRNSICVM
jgi:hypothetical protein